MHMNTIVRSCRRAAALMIGGAALLAAAPAPAQHGPLAMNIERTRDRTDELMRISKSLPRGGYAVVVDLDENELSFRQGRVVLWTAPIGTGTGLRLETDENEWDFSTPNGVFQVQYKEEDPTWIAPDWYFVENGLPVPPRDHRSRYFAGGLGAAAVYIGHDLAIHGTDKPELLGQRVSHGCIRLSNKDAQRLFHNVQIGTEVLIVGGEEVVAESAVNGGSTFNPEPGPRPRDPLLERWKRTSTGELASVLQEELWMPGETARWTEVVALLVDRGLEGSDDQALRAVLTAVVDLPNDRVEREYRTFITDIFVRTPMKTLAVLSDLDRGLRDRVASAIVSASSGLFSGDLSTNSAPWPTTRIPRESVGSDGRLGWNALARAEREQRTGSRVAEI